MKLTDWNRTNTLYYNWNKRKSWWVNPITGLVYVGSCTIPCYSYAFPCLKTHAWLTFEHDSYTKHTFKLSYNIPVLAYTCDTRQRQQLYIIIIVFDLLKKYVPRVTLSERECFITHGFHRWRTQCYGCLLFYFWKRRNPGFSMPRPRFLTNKLLLRTFIPYEPCKRYIYMTFSVQYQGTWWRLVPSFFLSSTWRWSLAWKVFGSEWRETTNLTRSLAATSSLRRESAGMIKTCRNNTVKLH